ncbi:EamA family transporter [Caulobacter hibisci]|uniref:DMT family transporter n=1 Tax=Caulobacter hibisci TaxID=2035993 RepID=A0ABS0T1I7_9CAUL|nr:DMT family transporter [Caulobacter hibisci]MBI1685735.1 DMT family transporter [Caulobacter hibisci]
MSTAAIRRPALDALLPYAALFGGMVTLAGGTSFAKSLFPMVGAQGTSAYRVGFAALLLLLLWRPWRFPLSRRDLMGVAFYGVATGVMNLCFYMALRTIPLGVALAIEFMGPLSLSLLHARKPSHFLCIGLAAFGLLLLLPLKLGAGALDLVGVAFALAAAVCWALYIVAGKRLGHLHGGRSVALGMSVAALVVVPFGIASAGAALLDPRLMLLGLVVAICSSAVPYSLEMIALKRIPKRTFGVMLSVEPAIGALAGVIVLAELLSPQQWIAIACIVAASAGAILTTTPETAVVEDPEAMERPGG